MSCGCRITDAGDGWLTMDLCARVRAGSKSPLTSHRVYLSQKPWRDAHLAAAFVAAGIKLPVVTAANRVTR